MTAAEILAAADLRTGQDNSSGVTDTQKLLLLNEGYADFCRVTEILQTSQDVVIAAYSPTVSLPSNFLDGRQFRWSYNKELYPKAERILDRERVNWKYQVGTPEYVTYGNYNWIRMQPYSSSAGTLKIRYCQMPTSLGLTDSPVIPIVYHESLIYFVESRIHLIKKRYDEFTSAWTNYVKGREEAKMQAWMKFTPDRFLSSEPVNYFNYQKWDSGYRSKGAGYKSR